MLQLDVPGTVWERMHTPLKLPEPAGITEKLTDPPGVIGAPAEVSRTVAVQFAV